MPRLTRYCPAGQFFHVLNRPVARLSFFEKEEVYEAFERALQPTWEIVSFPILPMTAMPNHWRFVVKSRHDRRPGELAENWRWGVVWLADPEGIVLPRQWRCWVNKPPHARGGEAIKLRIRRGRPYSSERRQKQRAARLGLESILRKRGRPRKETSPPDPQKQSG